MKHTCFIDTSSYVHLSKDDCYVNGKTLLSLFGKEVNLKFSNEVNHEISRHYTNLMPTSHERSSKVYKLKNRKIKTYKEYENRLFDGFSVAGDRNRGEKFNLAASLDCYLYKKTVGLIYLTDDKNAINSILKEPISCFPVLHIWNSFDVILFLLLRNKYFGIEFAETAIRNLNAELAKNHSPQTSPEKTQERINIWKTYVSRANRVQKLLNE